LTIKEVEGGNLHRNPDKHNRTSSQSAGASDAGVREYRDSGDQK
jgi:hypothetical protein